MTSLGIWSPFWGS